MSGDLWTSFVAGLAGNSILALDPATFRVAGGLDAADWETLDADGITPGATGLALPGRLYAWGDPQPDPLSSFHVAGSSLYQGYSAFLELIAPAGAADEAMVAAARNQLTTDMQVDVDGHSWAAYRAHPGLNAFLLDCLQDEIENEPPTVDFTVQLASDPDLRSALEPEMISAVIESPQPPFFGVDGRPGLLAVQPEPRADSGAALAPAAPAGWCRFQAKGMRSFSFMPGAWFDEAMIELFGGVVAGHILTGGGGLVHSCVAQILVSFRRTVTLQASGSAGTDALAAASQARSHVNLGGFYFGAGARQTQVTSPDPGTIVFEDADNSPYIVGVTLRLLGPASLADSPGAR